MRGVFMRFFLLPTLVFLLFIGPLAHASIEHGLATPVQAPDIKSDGHWFNSSPLSLEKLKGKVVLVDFWTYSCINCLRTFPYVKSWYERYKDKGFEIIGVHTPEFEFEKQMGNVEKAIKRFSVTWPVVQDNDFVIWKRFSNQYWPAHYLINREGKIVYTHFGEGNYDVTEKNIRTLLNETGPMAKKPFEVEKAAIHQSLETYLGSARAERLANPAKDDTFKFPEKLDPDYWALSGKWKREGERIIALEKNASLRLRFRAGRVFLVMASDDNHPRHARILYNGRPANEKAGKDAPGGLATIEENRLYELLKLNQFEEAEIEIQAQEAGLALYAFTFGANE